MEKTLEIWLVDDDPDDCILFQTALEQISISSRLTVVYNGEQLMEFLNKNIILPDILFLDLNMPRKNGFNCLTEIKKADRLKVIPIIVLSTSFRQTMADQLYVNGAQHYLRKPNTFLQLKTSIHKVIILALKPQFGRISKDQFVILESPHHNEKTE